MNVTGPATIGHVDTHYTPSHNKSYLSTTMEYMQSVTCIIQPTKHLVSAEKYNHGNMITTQKVMSHESLKSRQILCAHIPYYCRHGHKL